MHRQLWKQIVEQLRRIGKGRKNASCTFSDEMIVKVWFWAVINDRPVSWACCQRNWPLYEQRWQRPSESTMSRRLRSETVMCLLLAIKHEVLNPPALVTLLWFLDGKPLVISGCSKDRQSGYGRAARGMARGYKLHVLLGKTGAIAAWRVAPMNKDERVMGRRMLLSAEIKGYVLGDGNYDSNKLHAVCDQKGNLQLLTPRRYGPGYGFGHRRQTVGRMRSVQLLENPSPEFGEWLLHQRVDIERFFGNLTNWGGGLTHLPPWARTHRRVHRWVQGKLILNGLKRTAQTMTYVN